MVENSTIRQTNEAWANKNKNLGLGSDKQAHHGNQYASNKFVYKSKCSALYELNAFPVAGLLKHAWTRDDKKKRGWIDGS